MKSKYDIIWLNTIDSTNDEAKRHISELDNLSVLSALSQTKGRGQRENAWLSEPGENLLFSIVLKYASPEKEMSSGLPSIKACDQVIISNIAAHSVINLLAAHNIEARIKLPNDIYVGDKKISGILIEHTVCGKWLTSSIIGIGLNVNQKDFDASLPNPTSMVLCSKGAEEELELMPLLEEFMDIFTAYLDRFCHITGGYNRLEKLYRSLLMQKDSRA